MSKSDDGNSPTSIIKVDYVIIGAGPAGLTVYHILTWKGWRVIIVEARKRLGGRCFSMALDTTMVDDDGNIDFVKWAHEQPINHSPQIRTDIGALCVYGFQGASPLKRVIFAKQPRVLDEVDRQRNTVLRRATEYASSTICGVFSNGEWIATKDVIFAYR